ncbi:MAG: NUDIX domain-containing protein [Chitinophagales bacterium]|nr:NUDIX domain-containing protein [Bacteroidota bacterium]MCB9043703.1 NUDIX domain-containing protein [Chitinophagales bacterium]
MNCVYINEHKVFLLNQGITPPKGTIIVHYDQHFETFLQDIENNKSAQDFAVVFAENVSPLVALKQHCHDIFAAGGVVSNRLGEILIIYRLQKWDLPKGKIEANEGIRETALREVREETSIEQLALIRSMAVYPRFQPYTLHSYWHKNKRLLKTTYWFEMYAAGNESPKPQTEEGIEWAKWIPKKEIHAARAQMWRSVADVLENV